MAWIRSSRVRVRSQPSSASKYISYPEIISMPAPFLEVTTRPRSPDRASSYTASMPCAPTFRSPLFSFWDR